MGMSSDWAIELHNERMDTDAEYAANYEEAMRFDSALEAEWIERERISERVIDWFPDYRLDHAGYEEFDEAVFDMKFDYDDDDLPF